ncbi:MAG TPA: hypothetical protein VFK58_05860 [Sphingomicrobium sp.]|nr:hypothetical protein [Sphingomicrobium sp.]
MTYSAAIAATQRGLPPLRGRLLTAYRLAWGLLAAAALAVVALALLQANMPPLILALRLAKSAVVVSVALILFCRRQRDPVAAILALALLCWTVTSSFDFTSNALVPTLLDRLRFLLFALALLLFPDGRWRPRWTRHVALLSAAIFGLGVGEALGVVPTRLFLPLAIPCVLAAIAALVGRFRAASDEVQRQQLKWVALGLVSGVGLILAARAGAYAAPAKGHAAIFEAMFQLGIVLVALGFLVPLLRYRLYDAEAVISRSAAYAVLTAALVATFAGSEALIEAFGQQYLGAGAGQVSSAIAAAVAALLLTPLNDRIGNWAEQRFQRHLVELKEDLPQLLAEVPARWSPSQLGEAVLPRIAEPIHATRSALIAGNRVIAADGISRREARAAASCEDMFPLRLALRCPFGGVRGWLLLGPRPDGSGYGKDELEALEVIVPGLRRALLQSMEREVERRRDRSAERKLSDQAAALAARVEALEKGAVRAA